MSKYISSATKPTIFFLFSGQSRSSPFALRPTPESRQIMDSYNSFVFTELFKSKYEYKVYISTDDIHLQRTIEYFSESKIGNIHLLDTGYYMKPVHPEVQSVSHWLERYHTQHINSSVQCYGTNTTGYCHRTQHSRCDG